MLVMNGAEEAAPAPFPNASLLLELPFLGGSDREPYYGVQARLSPLPLFGGNARRTK